MDRELLLKFLAESRLRFGDQYDPLLVHMEQKLLTYKPLDITACNLLNEDYGIELVAKIRDKELQLQEAVMKYIYMMT